MTALSGAAATVRAHETLAHFVRILHRQRRRFDLANAKEGVPSVAAGSVKKLGGVVWRAAVAGAKRRRSIAGNNDSTIFTSCVTRFSHRPISVVGRGTIRPHPLGLSHLISEAYPTVAVGGIRVHHAVAEFCDQLRLSVTVDAGEVSTAADALGLGFVPDVMFDGRVAEIATQSPVARFFK